MRIGFQSPSLRGSGRFNDRHPRDQRVFVDVSIPFIAGQWSLLMLILFPARDPF